MRTDTQLVNWATSSTDESEGAWPVDGRVGICGCRKS